MSIITGFLFYCTLLTRETNDYYLNQINNGNFFGSGSESGSQQKRPSHRLSSGDQLKPTTTENAPSARLNPYLKSQSQPPTGFPGKHVDECSLCSFLNKNIQASLR